MTKKAICKWERWSTLLKGWICEYQKYDDGNCPYPELMCNYKLERLTSQKIILWLLREEHERDDKTED